MISIKPYFTITGNAVVDGLFILGLFIMMVMIGLNIIEIRRRLKKRAMKDNCEICHGAEGGVPGNENVVDGVVMCDYCDAKRTVYKQGTTLFLIIQDGVSRDFKTEQIITEAARSGYVIDELLVEAVRRDFHAQMFDFFKNHS